jgi:hypothetical protein
MGQLGSDIATPRKGFRNKPRKEAQKKFQPRKVPETVEKLGE